jgi:hypothetical protein
LVEKAFGALKIEVEFIDGGGLDHGRELLKGAQDVLAPPEACSPGYRYDLGFRAETEGLRGRHSRPNAVFPDTIGRGCDNTPARGGATNDEKLLPSNSLRVLQSGHLDIEHVAVHQEYSAWGWFRLLDSFWCFSHGGLSHDPPLYVDIRLRREMGKEEENLFLLGCTTTRQKFELWEL